MQRRKIRKNEIDSMEMFKLLFTFTIFTMAWFFMIMYGVTGKLI
ncbi:MAG: hypothetical protein PT934_07395 [Peptoniphilaceae bacterium]|nr:hypothetical protein [Parvimonas sp.]MDD7765576.1 hypothetical protein [Peptoniphilaceae bacterium]MDY3051117.1 hypothetical protein [Parvimonas sp.]